MSAIQVKGVPTELHERLRARARAEGRNLSDYVLDVLRRDLAVPSTQEWLERLRLDEPSSGISSERISESIREGRDERTGQILGAVTDRN
ncbi:MAG: FitA-like ribbon-helix-helix domain-containing protein [Solirubrobacteraceae bacterium]